MLESSIPQSAYQSKLFKAILLFLAIKGGMRLAIGGTLLALATLAFSVIVDAVIETCSHIAEIWAASSAIERLIILVLAVLFFRMVSPVAVRIYKAGRK